MDEPASTDSLERLLTVLGPRLDECRKQRGHIPNYVAVDYYDHGALMSEVDRLNGVS